MMSFATAMAAVTAGVKVAPARTKAARRVETTE